jgi:hypothetical protein
VTQPEIEGRERLAQERPERHVLPGLDVAGRPVVEQDDSEDMIGGVVGGQPARRRWCADDEPDLGLDVEALARPEDGYVRVGGLRWPCGRMTGVPLTTTVPARPW